MRRDSVSNKDAHLHGTAEAGTNCSGTMYAKQLQFFSTSNKIIVAILRRINCRYPLSTETLFDILLIPNTDQAATFGWHNLSQISTRASRCAWQQWQ